MKLLMKYISQWENQKLKNLKNKEKVHLTQSTLLVSELIFLINEVLALVCRC